MTHIGDKALSLFKRTEHHFFGSFVRAAFYHGKAVCSTSDYNLKLGFIHLLEGRVNHIVTVDIGHAACRDRSMERNIRNSDCSRRCNHCKNVRGMNAVCRNAGGHNLNLTSE